MVRPKLAIFDEKWRFGSSLVCLEKRFIEHSHRTINNEAESSIDLIGMGSDAKWFILFRSQKGW
jgi:hypothetical protein